MYSRCPDRSARTVAQRAARAWLLAARTAACALALVVVLLPGAGALAAADTLRVCADPDNLPYSHADGSGFENRIAQLVADELHASLAYEWLPQIRGYVRKTMG